MSKPFLLKVIFEINAETEESAKFLLENMLKEKGIHRWKENDTLKNIYSFKDIEI